MYVLLVLRIVFLISRMLQVSQYDAHLVRLFSVVDFLITDTMMVEDDDLMYSLKSFRPRNLSHHVGMCRAEAKRRLLKAQTAGFASSDTTDRILVQLENCLSLGAAPSLKRSSDQVHFEAQVRREVSRSIEEFTCNNDMAESTPDLDIRQWTSQKDNITRSVHVKLDRPATRIHVIDAFASPLECAAMEERVEGHLGPATTADGKGGFQLNQHRKAQQAYIYPDWTQEDSGDLVLRLNRRIFDYANDELGLNISPEGQEPLMSIQYFGRGNNDTAPDRYNAHCDGICEGGPLRHAGRMATMVVYCTVPEKGGMTNFNNAGVTIKPVAGSAIFFSYIDPLTKTADNGFSQHSGCPVYKGMGFNVQRQCARHLGLTISCCLGPFLTLTFRQKSNHHTMDPSRSHERTHCRSL